MISAVVEALTVGKTNSKTTWIAALTIAINIVAFYAIYTRARPYLITKFVKKLKF